MYGRLSVFLFKLETSLWKLKIVINYSMQDASKAESSALHNSFPNVTILVCYFHVKENIKKNMAKYLVPEQLRELV